MIRFASGRRRSLNNFWKMFKTCQLLIFSAVVLGTSQTYQQTRELKRMRNRISPVPKTATVAGRSRATWRLTATANRLFVHRLYRNIAWNQGTGNILVSPFLISTALSMTLLGAEGETEEELLETLGYEDMGYKKNGRMYTKEDVPRLYETLLTQLELGAGQGQYMLQIASRLFGDSSQTFDKDFLNKTEKYFGARLQQVDFANDHEGARKEINAWVKNRTMNTIPEAVPPGMISSATLLTLVSAAVFKGQWEKQFDPAVTYRGSFTMLDGTEFQTDFMHGDFEMKYRFSDVFMSHILLIPFKSQDTNSKYSVEMELFLPLKDKFLARVENSNEDKFHQQMNNMLLCTVDLHLPKVEIEYDIDLRETLQHLGITTLFGEADLSGMNGQRNLNIASVRHKTFLKVDEQGMTAGASVAQTMNRSAMRHIELHFDRTFVIIIREKYTNTVLFMGRIANPTH